MDSQTSTSSLGQKTVGGGISTVLMQVSCTAINMIGLGILARLLDAADFGLVAKVTAVTGFVLLIGDMGLSIATIQSEKISEQQLSAMFWVNVIVSSIIALFIFAVSPLIAMFYDDSRVIMVAIAFGANAVILGLGAQHLALITRHMKFWTLAAIDLGAVVFGITCAIFSVSHFGYMALLTQILCISLFKTIGYWRYSEWRPTLHLRKTGVRDKLKMGGNFTLSTFINYFTRNGDNVLIAKFWGEEALGFYSKAYSLLLMPMRQLVGPMSKVAVPALSRLNSEPEKYRSFFRKGVSIAMLLQIPVTIFAAFAGAEIILTILGPKWKDAIPIFYALIPNLMVSATAPATQWVFISRGDTARLVNLVLVNSVIVLIGFAIGVQYGAIGVAIAYSIVTCLMRVPNILYCFKPSPVTANDFFPFMIVPTICSLLAGLGCWVASFPFDSSSAWVVLVVKVMAFGLCYVLLVSFTAPGKDFFHQMKRYAASFLRTRVAPAQS